MGSRRQPRGHGGSADDGSPPAAVRVQRGRPLAGGGQLYLLHSVRFHNSLDPLLLVPRLPFEQLYAGRLRRGQGRDQPYSLAHQEPRAHAAVGRVRDRPLAYYRDLRPLDSQNLAHDNHRQLYTTSYYGV